MSSTKEEIELEPCPKCGGKVLLLGTDIFAKPNLLDATEPIYTLLCIRCQTFWDIEIKKGQLQDVWKEVCKKRKGK